MEIIKLKLFGEFCLQFSNENISQIFSRFLVL